jgi:hypothetical protein
VDHGRHENERLSWMDKAKDNHTGKRDAAGISRFSVLLASTNPARPFPFILHNSSFGLYRNVLLPGIGLCGSLNDTIALDEE